ncbi:MAG TPA: hypothetical protein VFK48_05935, partial [Usitatibacter sp.]|nr:hypothetical protein [Usitatibacter sp.]
VEPGTVWTWNAIGKASGAWALAPGADEARQGFLLNHLITDELTMKPGTDHDFSEPSPRPSPKGEGASGPSPKGEGAMHRISNSDPITGQAGWYDVRVRIRPAEADEDRETSPTFETMPTLPGTKAQRPAWIAYFAGKRR